MPSFDVWPGTTHIFKPHPKPCYLQRHGQAVGLIARDHILYNSIHLSKHAKICQNSLHFFNLQKLTPPFLALANFGSTLALANRAKEHAETNEWISTTNWACRSPKDQTC